MSRTFTKEFLQRLTYGDHGPEVKVISNEIVDRSRWSIHYCMVFEFEGKFYRTLYSRGATESQDEYPYQYDPDEIECAEVFPVQKTITVYE